MAYVPIGSCEGGAVFVSMNEVRLLYLLVPLKVIVVNLPANSRKKVWFVPVKKSVVFVPEDPREGGMDSITVCLTKVGMAYVPVSSSKEV